MPPEIAEKHMQVIWRTVETGEVQTTEYSLPMPDGERWYEGRTSLVAGDSESPRKVVWVARDITDRKRLEETLVQARDEAERANRRLVEQDKAKSAFLSSVSHEIRTPLTSLLGFSKLISKSFIKYFRPLALGNHKLEAKDRRIVENLAIIEAEGKRLTRLINNVLDLSKIESGRLEWNDMDMDPLESIEHVIAMTGGLFRHYTDARLEFDLPTSLPRLYMDPDRFQQILINLLSNAAKFTEQGSVRVFAEVEDQHLVIRVADTGPGISPEEQRDIFDIFYQAHRGDTPSSSKEGAGLGLAICRQIAEHYNGSIDVESVQGEGSTFTVRLPL